MHQLNEILNSLVSLTKEQEQSLYLYYQALVDTSKVMNLTAITKTDEVYIKHFYDSILCLHDLNQIENKKLLDIGSGAGFPGLVLKIIYPSLDITLLEPTKKRCDFLEKMIEQLQLSRIRVVNDRAENFSKDNREKFDYVVARAVAPMNIISELAIPYVKVGGYFLAMKGQNYQEECVHIDHIVGQLSSVVEKYLVYDLPLQMGKRVIIQIKKNKKTLSTFPRSYAKIKNQPLT